MKGTFVLTIAQPNYWDIQNFLHADRTYFGGKNTIIPYGEIQGAMLVTFETQGDMHPLDVKQGSWSAGDIRGEKYALHFENAFKGI